ncbi:UbiA family prenyltransferase [Dactylosporangium vinaceum]|uniref:UbiA family prenyltransferase n=1 Tax=Dactylosporangium vinaceum TaxID=53362 RepID=A0ABV5MLU5_9ACTN|nr:UbiA family prenyltransferase [Dactylosporangium vinaceum]UAB96886.1 UbiA family prenyltransferase [Dactylosporangium vinaceum]
MSVAISLLRASHPEPAAGVTAVSVLLSVGLHRPVWGVVGAGATVLASQLSIGWVNDALDAPRDAAAGRTDKPVAAEKLSRRLVAALGVAAAVVCVPLGFLSGWAAGLVSALALASALLYDWPLKSTVISPLPYAVSFTCLPAFVVLGAGKTPPLWLLAAGGLLGAGAHFVNTLPDLDADIRTGVRGLPQRLGRRGSLATAALLLLAATAALAFGPPGRPPALIWPAVAAALLALGFGWYRMTRDTTSRAPFLAVIAVALIDVVFLLISGLNLE